MKINIEGSEFSAIPQFLEDYMFKKLGVKQIMAEFHYLDTWGIQIDDLVNVFKSLYSSDYLIFHKEANLWCGSNCMYYYFAHKTIL
jgi:hypothetical protein